MRRLLLLACTSLLVAVATASPAAAAPRVVWLCKPGLKKNPCDPGLRTTRFSPSGTKLGVERPRRVRRPKIDCFYVYPTVSNQQTEFATRSIDPELRSIALYQAARYSQYCRVFAPIYRQKTLVGIFSGTRGLVGKKPYVDVVRAWRTYLRRYNRGRGVVVIGHSQGTFVLRRLIAREIDRKRSVRRRLVSAILLGGNVEVKKGTDVGGDFKHIRACRSSRQLGCVVAFSTFNATPPANSFFGQTGVPGRRVLCTNPTALGGGSGLADLVLPTEPFAPGGIAAAIAAQNVGLPAASTPWISVPNAYRARCTSGSGPRVLRITARRGAPTLRSVPTAAWGIHLADGNIALGNLVRLVRSEAAAFARRR